ncbi:MAG: putative polymerase, partial [Frankiales bacterium]|nr:putative polymerase [Frankiales bacterium]
MPPPLTAVVAGLGGLVVDGRPGTSGDLEGARLLWWRSATTGARLVAHGTRPRACWDLAAVGRLLYGGDRDDPPAVWAAAHGLPVPPRTPPPTGTLLDPVAPDRPLVDGQLVWDEDDDPAALGELARQVQARQAV